MTPLSDKAIALLPCPFCGGDDLQLGNTHTPKFSVECLSCNAEVGGLYFPYRGKKDNIKFHYDPELPALSPFDATELRQMPAAYQKAAASAVEAWNRRTPVDAASHGEDEARVSVPKVPTEAMIVAGFECKAMNDLLDASHGWPYSCRETAAFVTGVYAAMIAASASGGEG